MQSTETDTDDVLARVSGSKPAGRVFFALLAIAAGALLLVTHLQTEAGEPSGGWWNAPHNAPYFALGLMLVCSVLASATAAPAETRALDRATVVSLVLAAAFMAAIWLITVVGYGFAVLAFAALAARVAGFRGRGWAQVSLGMTAAMVIFFRHILGLWFPQAALVKLVPGLELLGRVF